MDKKISRIIVITEYPFNKRDNERFGIDILRHHSFDVEIWDITSYLHKKYEDKLLHEDPNNFPGLRLFSEKSDITDAIAQLDTQSLVLFIAGFDYHTCFILQGLSRKKIGYCIWGGITMPLPTPQKESLAERFFTCMKRGSALKIKGILQHIINRFLLKHYTFFGIAPASIILLSGEKSTEHYSYPVNEKTVKLWTHYLDYDIYLEQKDQQVTSVKRTAVFLDIYLPFHPDFLHSDTEFPISPEEYYPKLCNLFSVLEKKFQIEIIIAAHPRSDYGNKPDYFCGRTIIKGETARLIKESVFVIVHSSTAVDFAVFYKKPVIFITTNEIQRLVTGKNLHGLYIRSVSSALGKELINIDQGYDFDWEKEMTIDEEAYRRYKNLYIKKEGTPEKPVWEIFSSYLMQETQPEEQVKGS